MPFLYSMARAPPGVNPVPSALEKDAFTTKPCRWDLVFTAVSNDVTLVINIDYESDEVVDDR